MTSFQDGKHGSKPPTKAEVEAEQARRDREREQAAARAAGIVREATARVENVTRAVEKAMAALQEVGDYGAWLYRIREGAHAVLHQLGKVEAGMAPIEDASTAMAIEPLDMAALRSAAQEAARSVHRLCDYGQAHRSNAPELALIYDLARKLEKQIARIRWQRLDIATAPRPL